jgi:hypothetical protein
MLSTEDRQRPLGASSGIQTTRRQYTPTTQQGELALVRRRLCPVSMSVMRQHG